MSEKNGSFLPKWSPEISFGQAIQAILVAIGGIWLAFGVLGSMRDQISAGAAQARDAVSAAERRSDTLLSAQATKIMLVEQDLRAQLAAATDWKNEMREQFKAVNDRQDATNKILGSIQLGLANKVDRRP